MFEPKSPLLVLGISSVCPSVLVLFNEVSILDKRPIGATISSLYLEDANV